MRRKLDTHCNRVRRSIQELVVGHPSLALTILRKAVRSGVLPRGYSWLLAYLPSRLWGGQNVLVETGFGAMCVRTSDRSASSLALHRCLPHERRETALVSALARSCTVMVDIGAHYGWYTRVMARAASGSRVYAFEPDPMTYRYLLKNTSDLPNVVCLNVAMGEKVSEATLWRAHSRSDLNSTVRRVGAPVGISQKTLDRFCREQGIDQVDFIKCDVEGGEVNILRGARELIRNTRPPIWMLEVSEQFLAEAGFEPDNLLVELRRGCPTSGKLFTQDAQGNPVEIEKLSDRMLGNNVFFVPTDRLQQFDEAAGVLDRQRIST